MVVLAVAAGLAPEIWAAGQAAYRRIAEEIARLAERSSVRTVAVLPFKAVSPSDEEGAEAVSERLSTCLGGQKRVQLVERALLHTVLDEQKLQRTGMVDEARAKKLGRVIGVDAVVSGSILRAGGGKAELNARLIHAEDGRVLGTASAEVPRDWSAPVRDLTDSPAPSAAPPPAHTLVVPPPKLEMDFPPSFDVSFKPWWEAKAASAAGFDDDGCSRWEERLDALQRAGSELKARYWAAKLLEPGFSRSSLTRNPGSEIRDLRLRADFYRRLKELYDAGEAPALSEAERELLISTEKRASALLEDCR